MTDQQHPITPPPELVQQWTELPLSQEEQLVVAARWGSDQELEACCEWLKAKEWIHPEFSDELRAARRPKPPSLKEQALAALDEEQAEMSIVNYKTIRAVLEQLDD